MKYSGYALFVLILAYILAFIDRQILTLLVEPLKRDLGLNDSQIGLLQGLSFALFLSIGGLPIGRLIDKTKRTRILALGIAAWSAFTASCGLVSGFIPLFLCRVGVGFGESTMTPSAFSLIGDYFKGRKLGLALGIYNMGPYLGSGLALILGGMVIKHLPAEVILPWLGSLKSWQVIFLALGPIGLIMALWVASLREPQRSGPGGETPARPEEVRAYFASNALTLVCVNASVMFSAMAMYSLSAWAPSFFARTYHIPTAVVGPNLGLRVMIFGAAGALLAGFIGDFLRQRGWTGGRLIVLITAAAIAAPVAYITVTCQNQALSFNLIGPLMLCLTLAISSGPALLQEITPNRMRGLQHALAVLSVNLFGLGLGPSIVAAVSNFVLYDEARLYEALSLTLPTMLGLSATIGALTLPPYGKSLSRHAAGLD